MDQENTFSYTYSAQVDREVRQIREKYLPRPESKLDELKRLDDMVRSAGVMESLCAGVGGCLVFGLGLCLAMGVIGQAVWLGILLGLVGAGVMLSAFPVYRRAFHKAKERHSPRILELIAELSGEE